MSGQPQAPVFAPVHPSSELNRFLSSVDLDEIFSSDFLLPEGVQGPRRRPSVDSEGGFLQQTLELVDPSGAAEQANLPGSLSDLLTPQTGPEAEPGALVSAAEAAAPSIAAVERAAAMLGMARSASSSASGRKRPRATGLPGEEEQDDDELGGDAADRVERRLRNREHAKRSRLRKKFMLESLQNQLTDLRETNQRLRNVIRTRFGDVAEKILDECTEPQSTILIVDPNVDANPLKDDAEADAKTVQIMEQDYRLIHSLQMAQQCFAISDPSLPDNPIVFASPGFVNLTGYSLEQILGRNCRFLQGPGTDQRSVQMIRDAITEERDVSVCLLNYKADGTPFWNQFFIAPLRACDGAVVNFVGVQCEVESAKPEDIMQRVKRIKNIETLGE
mmetsp:Transcript_14727/g.55743  ORF Transcript_14727/g.55743 Transcript_14727/m.55743 type:complete len:390 (-) Transcript_14727:110-1279(-)